MKKRRETSRQASPPGMGPSSRQRGGCNSEGLMAARTRRKTPPVGQLAVSRGGWRNMKSLMSCRRCTALRVPQCSAEVFGVRAGRGRRKGCLACPSSYAAVSTVCHQVLSDAQRREEGVKGGSKSITERGSDKGERGSGQLRFVGLPMCP